MVTKRLNIPAPKWVLKDKGWWHEIYCHQSVVLIWLFLNLVDGALTQLGVSQGWAYELNPFLKGLPPLAFALQKFFLTILAVMWLATWRWLWALWMLNFVWVVILALNLYEVSKVFG